MSDAPKFAGMYRTPRGHLLAFWEDGRVARRTWHAAEGTSVVEQVGDDSQGYENQKRWLKGEWRWDPVDHIDYHAIFGVPSPAPGPTPAPIADLPEVRYGYPFTASLWRCLCGDNTNNEVSCAECLARRPAPLPDTE